MMFKHNWCFTCNYFCKPFTEFNSMDFFKNQVPCTRPLLKSTQNSWNGTYLTQKAHVNDGLFRLNWLNATERTMRYATIKPKIKFISTMNNSQRQTNLKLNWNYFIFFFQYEKWNYFICIIFIFISLISGIIIYVPYLKLDNNVKRLRLRCDGMKVKKIWTPFDREKESECVGRLVDYSSIRRDFILGRKHLTSRCRGWKPSRNS